MDHLPLSIPQSPPQLKVCGLTKLDQITELASLPIDFLGFIFYEKSPRYVLNHLRLEDIAKIEQNKKVGVFVNESLDKIIEIATCAKLNFIQLHGDESTIFIKELRKKLHPEIEIINVIRIGNYKQEINRNLQEIVNAQLSDSNYFLFDTDSKAFGGTGLQFDWDILNTIKIPLPYFLSGGVSEKNIKNIKNLNQKPIALDINSKFEMSPGNKDILKIASFKNELNLAINDSFSQL
ncbi:phosphoribosylanthranilate isomerase [Chryseobacterium potabilaquae]|uniref:N-(5'-phosphoribosyl)anthranilate isomerase n=1 Tax=Chryseobacterium potabilaquae TaxID=2675057 RepID=A0A6N4WYS1_9FLAO|nr:phosphoribosylanthranilate isomerase [Chryseobacterium potabilaquae]CAA7193607.1 N-(5'-phosphoribosyl)anthranilate isomerase [Chryseobacterium potabilaquae]